MKYKAGSFLILLLLVFISGLKADYAEGLQQQIQDIRSRFNTLHPEYFRDMSIVARKADDAGLKELTAEIIRTHLWEKMEEYIEGELEAVKTLYPDQKLQVKPRLTALFTSKRYFEPSQDFLKTALGQSILTDTVQSWERSLNMISKCSEVSVRSAIVSIQKINLFVTQTPAEMKAQRDLINGLDCCLGWKREIKFYREQEFETDYEEGTYIEDASLRLVTSRADWAEARWEGVWYYRYKGRDGTGLGTSQAALTYRKGEELAFLTITPSRMTSVGRMNFPNALSGENRTLEIGGEVLSPLINDLGYRIELTGCQNEK